MQHLSRGQIFGIVVILLVATSFGGAVVYGVMFGDTSAAKQYSAVSPSERAPNPMSGATTGSNHSNN